MDTKKPSSSSGCLVTGLALFFLILGIADGMIGKGIERYRLKQRGVATSGIVVEWRSEERPLGKQALYITYRFDAETGDAVQQITKEEYIDYDTYESLQQDAPVSVVYLPDNPNVSTIQDVNGALNTTLIWAALTLGGLGLGIFALANHGLGQSVLGLGGALIVMGVMGLVHSFFEGNAMVGPTRSAYALMAILGLGVMLAGLGLVTIQRQR